MYSISLFLPAYNEEKNLKKTTESCKKTLESLFQDWELIIVNDGSADGTAQIAQQLKLSDPTRIRIVTHEKNRGYGAALRSGFEASSKELICFMGADGQFDSSEIKLLLDSLGDNDIVAPYRIKRSDPFYRKINEVLYYWFIRLLLGLNIWDVDCGFKLIRKKVFEKIVLEADGALIDAELFVKAEKAGFKVVQVGVHHSPRLYGKQTGASLRVIFKMFFEVFKLRKKLDRV